MDLDEAREIAQDPGDLDVRRLDLEMALETLLARIDALEAGEVTTEWAVQYGGNAREIEARSGEADARVITNMYRHDGAVLVQREVRRGPVA